MVVSELLPLSCAAPELPLENPTANLSSKHRKLSVILFHKAVGCLLCTTRVQCLSAQAGMLCPSREAKLCSQDFLNLFSEMVVSVGTYLISPGLKSI